MKNYRIDVEWENGDQQGSQTNAATVQAADEASAIQQANSMFPTGTWAGVVTFKATEI